jgi:hypothetical protein
MHRPFGRLQNSHLKGTHGRFHSNLGKEFGLHPGLHGRPPAEAEIAQALCVSAPSVNTMIKMLEKRGLILRQPGKARSLQILIPVEEIPPWGNRRKQASSEISKPPPILPAPLPPAKLYVLSVFLTGGPIGKKSQNKVCNRVIEIRGDQTLDQLHRAIFQAYDREEDHRYEFQFGKRPFDPAGPNYGILQKKQSNSDTNRDARTTTLDELGLGRQVFGYWFDFGDNWYHQIQVERVESAISTVTYPRVIKRVGASPPQYPEDDE